MIYFKSTVEKLLAEKDAQIAMLKAENDDLKRNIYHERQRAETAIDRLLQTSGVRAVTPQKIEKPSEKDIEKKKIQRILASVFTVGKDFDPKKSNE